MKNNSIVKEDVKIENLIYEIRGKQVMLDSDLANLYKCINGAKTINQAVNRHLDRFPNDFYFRVTDEEYDSLRSQIGTLKSGRGKHKKYLPYVFTEQGVAMLATVLRTEVASQMSIAIMRAFVAMRHYLGNNEYRISNIETKLLEHDSEIRLLQEYFNKFKEKNSHIFFNGQIYDAHSLLIDILSKSKKEIIIIDNYIDKNLLDILSKIKKKIILITNKYNNVDYEKYKKQYFNIELIINNGFHDRFIIIDRSVLYHCGASFKDLGKGCFVISKLEDKEYLNILLSKVINYL